MEQFKPVERVVEIADPYDLGATLRVLQHGAYDPTTRATQDTVWKATRNQAGAVTVRYARETGGVRVTAWGPGADAALESAPDVLGVNDDFASFQPHHDLIRNLARRFAGIRFPATHAIFDALIPAILEQKVTSVEAFRSYNALVRKHGGNAPGPAGLRCAPPPEAIAAIPYYTLHAYGVERRRADVLREACSRSTRMNEAAAMPPSEARARLCAIRGIGAWTANEVTRITHGDPDAVSVGDFHIPNMVAWALAGEARADDARMLELLEPFAGHRARVIRLFEAAGLHAPAFGPKHRIRSIPAI
ncbi:MAG: 3-methyladenine DNA glycosylase [Actinomycetota bacterium]